ncbi:MAG: LysM peptidoglycan-binding domain-containing protein, partial [Gemmatimonadota bacterium]
LNETLGILDQAVARMDAAAEAERRAAEAAAAAARRAVYHLVQRGEALELIARRYGVPVDSLLSWNGLTNTRIVAGTRLLVRPEIK